MNRPDIRSEALWYLALGWSFYPTRPRSKAPYTELLPTVTKADGKRGPGWSGYQARQPGIDEADAWFLIAPDANLALVTGAVSGLVIIDVDNDEALHALKNFLIGNGVSLPRTVCVRSRRGWHFYFAHPGEECRGDIGLADVDVKADGGCCTAPPSIHSSGHLYRWHHSPEQIALAPLPLPILEILRENRRKKERPIVAPAQIYFPGQHPYGRTVLQNAIAELRAIGNGRNIALNRTAFSLAGFIATGVLDEATVRGALTHVAHEIGLEHREIGPTINSGLADGYLQPRFIPENSQPSRSRAPKRTGSSLADLRAARAGF